MVNLELSLYTVSMNQTLNTIMETGLIPVIKIEDADQAVPLARALLAGGLECAEITFRTAAAADAIRAIRSELPGMLVGAGTIINTQLAEQAVKAGASFIVSPGFNPAVVDYCQEHNVPVIPGINTPSGIEAALEKGLRFLKFFPAEVSGGPAMLDALAGPFPDVLFMPTGGIDAGNLHEWLSRPNVAACGGSWMVKPDMIASSDWDGITSLTKAAMATVHSFGLGHIGINTEDETRAQAAAQLFSLFFNRIKDGTASIFCGTPVEIMKKPFRGTCGHIGITCLNIERALRYLAPYGFTPVMETAKYTRDRLSVVYLEPEVAGFALHLMRV